MASPRDLVNRINRLIKGIKDFDFWGWIGERAGLNELPLMGVPDYMFRLGYWTGGMAAAAFFWQLITGLILLMYYEPSNPYGSTMDLINTTMYGKLLLASHLYGAYVMIFLVFMHMFRNYFVGAYKRPRELQWMLGVIMGAITLGIAFFGYSLVGDTLSVDGVDVAKGLLQGVPGGSVLISIVFGNGGELQQYTRVLAWHITLAGLLLLLLMLHLGLAEQHGIMPSPRTTGHRAPVLVDRREMPPWWPRNFLYMVAVLFWTWGFILIIPSVLLMLPPGSIPILFSPTPGPPPTSPAAATIPPYPLWFFLNIYKIVDLGIPAFQGTTGAALAATIGGGIPLIFLFLLPLLDRSDKLHPLDRVGYTIVMVWLLIVWLVLLSVLGALTPGVIIPVNIAAIIVLPPTVVIIAGLYLARRTWVNSTRVGNGVSSVKGNEGITLREVIIRRAYATLVLIVLTAVEVAILAVFWRISINMSIKVEPLVGFLVGIAMVVFGEIVALYRYIMYPAPPSPSGGVSKGS